LVLGPSLGVARRARQEVEPGIHHVYARGNDRRRIYLDDADRERYLAALGRVAERQRWGCMAYCLMDNHVHLLIETREPNLGTGMHRLHGGYAQSFNARHGCTGHLFQGRYGAVRIKSDAQLVATVAYIVRNPVEAGLCARPEEWAWSSHGATLAGRAPAWLDVAGLLRYFGAAGGEPRRRYADALRT
jgi:REP element-mobilizing transposase RayT